MLRQVISGGGARRRLTDERFLNVSCARQKSERLRWEENLEGIFGGVNFERPDWRVRHGAEVRFVMDLQRLHEGGVKDHSREKKIHTSVCFLKRQLWFLSTFYAHKVAL